ncbi:MAG: ATP-binding cassette domain-containing protein, partial [Janthinobacterium lividum]
MPPRIELRGIGKRFGDVVANADIDLTVEPGEIHALLGENGAGKSTLVKMMVGLLRPDAGTIAWDGRVVAVDGPHAARALGIGMVHQHFSLFERMTVLENVALGLDGQNASAALATRIRDVSAAYRLPLDPDRPVFSLSVGERQLIEIVRCLLQSPRLLIMDEPTSVLTPQEAERLFAVVRRVAASGCAVLYISHKLAEIRALCDRATVLRAGRVVGACIPTHETPASLARLMIGTAPEIPRRGAAPAGAVRLETARLELPAATLHGTALRAVSL